MKKIKVKNMGIFQNYKISKNDYIFKKWDTSGYKAIAIAYLEREKVYFVGNANRRFYSFALFVHRIGATNIQKTRISITQSYDRKRCIKTFDYKFNSIIDQVESYLEQIDKVVSYNTIIGNTTFNDYIISIETLKNQPLINLIKRIKEL